MISVTGILATWTAVAQAQSRRGLERSATRPTSTWLRMIRRSTRASAGFPLLRFALLPRGIHVIDEVGITAPGPFRRSFRLGDTLRGQLSLRGLLWLRLLPGRRGFCHERQRTQPGNGRK